MHKGNITSGFEDNINLSNTFLDKYAEIEEQAVPTESLPAPVETPVVESKTSKRIASKDELPGLGFTSEGTGIYKDSSHHLWELSRAGEGYNITRVAEEEDILTEKKVASKVASQVTVSSDGGLGPFFANLDQNGIYYNKVSENTTDAGYSAIVDIDAEDMPDFTTVARDSGVKTGAKEGEGRTEECKVFSDEAVLTGISHYITMGYDKKEAVNNFIASNELDKKYYSPLINEVLDRYNY